MPRIKCPHEDCDVVVRVVPTGKDYKLAPESISCVLGHGPYMDKCPNLREAKNQWYEEFEAARRELAQEKARRSIIRGRDD